MAKADPRRHLSSEIGHDSGARRLVLPPGERRRLFHQLFAPLDSGEAGGAHKAALLAILFQPFLVSHLPRVLERFSVGG